PTPEPVRTVMPTVAPDAPDSDPGAPPNVAQKDRLRATYLARGVHQCATDLGGLPETPHLLGAPLAVVLAHLTPDERIAVTDDLPAIPSGAAIIEEGIAEVERAERDGA